MSTDDFTLGVIDLDPYLNPKSPEDKERVIAQVVDVCRRQGFFQVKNHGVPMRTQQGMIQSCRNLFNLPKEEKLGMSFLKSMNRRGYEGSGDSHREGDALPDSKEV